MLERVVLGKRVDLGEQAQHRVCISAWLAPRSMRA
jgi:hypothetical protein